MKVLKERLTMNYSGREEEGLLGLCKKIKNKREV